MTTNVTLMINGRKQFFAANGTPLAGGFVYYYTPGTTSFKTTWKDAGQVATNTNPIILDAAGSAVVYGAGQYREYVTDASANLIQDALTQNTGYSQALTYGTIVVGASPFTYTNTTAGEVSVVVSGGTVSSIQLVRGGVGNIIGVTAGLITLSAGDALIVTYSVIPGMLFYNR